MASNTGGWPLLEIQPQTLTTEGRLLGFGHPLLDITADVTEEFLKKYELEPDNVILGDKVHENLANELVSNFKARYSAGGSTQNSVRVAQWVLNEPRATAFLGCIGNDNFGREMRTKAEQDGVDAQYIVDRSRRTGTCAVLVTNQGLNRSLVSFLGAAASFNKHHVIQKWPTVKRAKVYYCAGFSMVTGFEAVLELAQHALEHGKKFAINLSACYVCEMHTQRLKDIMPFVDIVFGNADEMRALAKALGWELGALGLIAASLSALPSKKPASSARLVLLTQGAGPVLAAQGDDVTSFEVPGIPTELVRDTNGAGDAFVGGFLAQATRALPLGVCVRTGIFCAGKILQVSGVSLSAFSLFDESHVRHLAKAGDAI